MLKRSFEVLLLDSKEAGMTEHRYRIELAVAGIIRDGLGRVALVRRRQEPQRGLWHLPGGPAEYGESLQESLRRLVRAQTGITIDIADNRPAAVTQTILASRDLQVVTVHYAATIHGGYDGRGYHPGGAFPNTRLVDEAAARELELFEYALEVIRTHCGWKL